MKRLSLAVIGVVLGGLGMYVAAYALPTLSVCIPGATC